MAKASVAANTANIYELDKDLMEAGALLYYTGHVQQKSVEVLVDVEVVCFRSFYQADTSPVIEIFSWLTTDVKPPDYSSLTFKNKNSQH